MDQIDLCRADVNAMTGTLKETLETNKDQVTKLYVDVQELVLLIKTEMTSQSGLLIVFSDNDGD